MISVPPPFFVRLPAPPIGAGLVRKPPGFTPMSVAPTSVIGPAIVLLPLQFVMPAVTPSPNTVKTFVQRLGEVENETSAPARTKRLLDGLPIEVVVDSNASRPPLMSMSPSVGSTATPTREIWL